MHDYYAPCVYHITLSKADNIELFGRLAGQFPDVYIEKSNLGEIVEQHLRTFNELNDSLELLEYIVMPDHVHILVNVKSRLNIPIGNFIRILKLTIGKDYGRNGIFNPDFHDRFLRKSSDWAQSLLHVTEYIRQNPYRLAVRRVYPEYFTRVTNFFLNGEVFQLYGNRFLLDNPFKEQVIVHRADSADVREENMQRWLHVAANGGVLVSPFISQDEKAVRKAAEDASGNFILITNEAMPERYKPAAHDFALCTQGRLLIIAPTATMPPSRQTFVALNRLAAFVANSQPTVLCRRL